MKNMSFAHTTQQCVDYLKTVTRSPYIYRLPIDVAIENWLIETFRFEL